MSIYNNRKQPKKIIRGKLFNPSFNKQTNKQTQSFIMLWEPYPSHHHGLFSPLLVLRDFATRGRSILVLSEQYETSYLYYVALSFLCNIICYLISVFAFSVVTLSGATIHYHSWVSLFVNTIFLGALPTKKSKHTCIRTRVYAHLHAIKGVRVHTHTHTHTHTHAFVYVVFFLREKCF